MTENGQKNWQHLRAAWLRMIFGRVALAVVFAIPYAAACEIWGAAGFAYVAFTPFLLMFAAAMGLGPDQGGSLRGIAGYFIWPFVLPLVAAGHLMGRVLSERPLMPSVVTGSRISNVERDVPGGHFHVQFKSGESFGIYCEGSDYRIDMIHARGAITVSYYGSLGEMVGLLP